MKKILLATIGVVLLALLVLTSVRKLEVISAVLEEPLTQAGISGETHHYLFSVDDNIETWEIQISYDIEEYLLYYGLDSEEDVRDSFKNVAPSAVNFPGIDYELVDVTSEYVITRMLFDDREISPADFAFAVESAILADSNLSFEKSVTSLRERGSFLREKTLVERRWLPFQLNRIFGG